MICFDQFIVSTVKFEKRFVISLLWEIDDKAFVITIEATNMRRCSSKANKMIYINTIKGTLGRLCYQELEN